VVFVRIGKWFRRFGGFAKRIGVKVGLTKSSAKSKEATRTKRTSSQFIEGIEDKGFSMGKTFGALDRKHEKPHIEKIVANVRKQLTLVRKNPSFVDRFDGGVLFNKEFTTACKAKRIEGNAGILRAYRAVEKVMLDKQTPNIFHYINDRQNWINKNAVKSGWSRGREVFEFGKVMAKAAATVLPTLKF